MDLVTAKNGLSKCPFCGASASWWGTPDTEWVSCEKCYASSDVVNVGEGRARQLWNQRFSDKNAECKRLRDIISRARFQYCFDGSDAEAAAKMFKILSEEK